MRIEKQRLRSTDAHTATRKMVVSDVHVIVYVIVTVAAVIAAGTFTLLSERFAANLARDARHQSEMLMQKNDQPGAVAAIRRAVDLYRDLTDIDPVQYEPELAASLHELSIRLNETGDAAGALAAIGEAVEMRRRLTGFGASDPAHLEESLQLLTRIGATGRGELP